MLFREDILRGIADGRVTLAFRRWRKAPPRAGSTLRTPVGVLTIDRVDVVGEDDITPDDVGRTGLSADALRASLAGDGALVRIELRLSGPDPRIALREQPPTAEEVGRIEARLARFDATAPEPWTMRCLQLVADRPATVARVLAAAAGTELASFKRRVRQLKELGLTESLDVGYRLSPRGEAVLASTQRRSNRSRSTSDSPGT
jgi:hypothetical protein